MDLCTLAADDIHILTIERQRVAEDFRGQIASVGMLRGLLTQAPTQETREQLHAAIEHEAPRFYELADKLLHLEASLLALQGRGPQETYDQVPDPRDADLPLPRKEVAHAARHL